MASNDSIVPPDDASFSPSEVSRRLLVGAGRVPAAWSTTAAKRIRALRDELRKNWVGLRDESGYLVDWVLAGTMARENVLLLGRPGVAKSEIAVRTFEGLGLTPPAARDDQAGAFDGMEEVAASSKWWKRHRDEAANQQRYFHYLLSRFTQPEELFGPVEISLLRRGRLVRVNFGLLTGPGVRAAFLDEIFKASSTILNTLLTLTQERLYFNWGGMMPADLVTLIGASNELPGGFGRGQFGVGGVGEDFSALHAFLDRFPIRLLVREAHPEHRTADSAGPRPDDLTAAFDEAIRRESLKFTTGSGFVPPVTPSHQEHNLQPKATAAKASINDLLLLGRAALQQETNPEHKLFSSTADFRAAFTGLARGLFASRTQPGSTVPTWTISPRKLKAVYKIALCHAIVTDDMFTDGADFVRNPGADQLWAFAMIWDSEQARDSLTDRVRNAVAEAQKGRR